MAGASTPLTVTSMCAHVAAVDERLAELPDEIGSFINETVAFADDAKAISKR